MRATNNGRQPASPARSPAAPTRNRLHAPLTATSQSFYRPTPPTALDCISLTVIRDGSAIIYSEFGQQHVKRGDVVLLGANTLCGSEPEGHVTTTVILANTDYVVDQVFWQYVGVLRDRLHAQDFAASTIFAEPAQILRIGEDRVGLLTPWLDEMVALSIEDRPVETFHRIQALWFHIAGVVAPLVRTSVARTSSTQRTGTSFASPRVRRMSPLRDEARTAAALLRAAPERRWSLSEIAAEVHLSKSQLCRVFVEAFGKAPIAFLTMLRVERMAALLRTTDAPIMVIAREVGWSDADFAARQFRRNVGVTPTEYRKLSREQRRLASG